MKKMKQTKKLNLNKFKIASINKKGLGKIVGGNGGGDTIDDVTTTDDIGGPILNTTNHCNVKDAI